MSKKEQVFHTEQRDEGEVGESAGPWEGPVGALEAVGGYGEGLRRGVAHLSSEGRVPELHLTLWCSFFH